MQQCLNKTKSIITLSLLLVLSYINIYSIYASNNQSNFSYYHTLSQYINIHENVDTELKLLSEETDKSNHTIIRKYSYSSQRWPKSGPKAEQRIWQHHLNVYIPTKIKTNTALIWLNGGIINSIADNNKNFATQPYPLYFAQIADKAQAIVVDLQDIPNQYVTIDGQQYAEDALIARTWSKFIQDPANNQYMPAYLPMVKTVIKAMDNLNKLQGHPIDDFVISGLSKRGMTTWLTALHDERVKAIIPLAIDVLNFESNINHIHQSLQDWPIALHDYYEQNVVQKLSTENSKLLMQISDPYQYITCSSCQKDLKNKFQQRASLQKYIIAASGDDFFTPDSSHFYYNKLPGHNNIRYVPNSRHYIDQKVATDSVLSYFYHVTHNLDTPFFKAKIKKDFTSKDGYTLEIRTNKKPQKILLYSAVNTTKRDFRLANGINYQQSTIDAQNYNHHFFNNNGIYKYRLSIKKPITGWQAYFVEYQYEPIGTDIPGLVLTSPIEILPKNYPALIKSKIKETTEQIVQYGNRVLYKR